MTNLLRSFLIITFIALGFLESNNEHSKKEILLNTYWHLGDFVQDSVLGVSLLKAYNELYIKHENKIDQEIIIAVLDTEVDVYHPRLASSIWINPKEENNGVDDDDNGYIDDINGWNFLGNPSGKSVLYQKHESTRLLNLLRSNSDVINKDSSSFNYKTYLKAETYVKEKRDEARSIISQAPKILEEYREELKNPILPPDDEITLGLLDSLISSGSLKKEKVKRIYWSKSYGMVLQDLVDDLVKYENRLKIGYNHEYDDRSLIGDDPYDFTDTIYGNNQVNANIKELWHGTQTAGMLVGDSLDTSFIKLMPLNISNNGNEYDKDIYLAMKYAVDNGARIINICTGKTFSINEHWFDKILKYAEVNDVLIVSSAGNTNRDLDDPNNNYFPDDIKNGQEFISNFMRIGASGKYLDKNLKTSFSSYGKENVDIFAPGIDITTTSSIDKSGYTITEGTSLSTPIVSRIAAMIFSKYPSLTAPQVKQILMDSSVKYDIIVDVPTKENPKQQLPFSELSKSGGIINAYNALLMAEEVSKN